MSEPRWVLDAAARALYYAQGVKVPWHDLSDEDRAYWLAEAEHGERDE